MSKKLILGAGLLTVMLPLGSVYADGNVYSPSQGTPVHFNWGGGGPGGGIPVDKFTAIFDQSQNFASGDYFIQALADDGVKVEVDGQLIIDRWSNSPVLVTNRALWTGVQSGQHTVKTHYYEDGGNASVFSDVVPFDSWLAYYYPNENLAGAPIAARVIDPVGDLKQLSEKHGISAPISGIKSDYFSARYTTAKRIPAGEYILRAKADDGLRVYVDGNLVLDRWTPAPVLKENAAKIKVADRLEAKAGEKDVHWVEVEYYEGTGNSQVDFTLEPFEKVIEDSWVAEYYPNTSLQGTPYVEADLKQSGLNFNWNSSSPHSSIPTDWFSARFTKNIDFQEGIYDFQVRSDDGVRLWVDNQLVIDSWVNSPGELKTGRIAIEKGRHKVKVEYFEGSGLANLSMNYQPFVSMPIQTGGDVHYNWGSGSPSPGISVDKFTALFDQSKHYTKGDYFIQALADDGVKVEVDGEFLVNRWNNSPALIINRALWTGVQEGQHTVKTHYYEDSGNASVFSDVVPFDSWLAYYYPNETLSGAPIAARIINPVGELKQLTEYHGTREPITGIKSDHFSAHYTSAKRITAGEYILRAKADDGVRVYVDGKLVLDRWTPAPVLKENAVKIQVANRANAQPGEEDVHWVEVEYYEGTGNSQVDFSLEPFQHAIEDTWIAEYYPNMSLEGNPFIQGSNGENRINKVDFNWGAGSPHSDFPNDHFSARFTKIVNLVEGMYNFEAISDDGLRVWVDNQMVIDSWKDSGSGSKNSNIMISSGTHQIRVEYFENTGNARLSLDIKLYKEMETKIQEQVHYNWGNGSPEIGIPADYFISKFDQSKIFSKGDYFIQTLADDAVKVEVDGAWPINRWIVSPKVVTDRALWLGVTEGHHTIKTHYYENTGGAAVFSDIVPFDTWLAYYYPNTTLSGTPTAAKVIQPNGEFKKLYENHGVGVPVEGVQSDNFSAKYSTAKRISAGNYMLRAKADDGVRVYVDGKLVIDRWTPGTFSENTALLEIKDRVNTSPEQKDVHWIDVEYYDGTHNSAIEFFMEPYSVPIIDPSQNQKLVSSINLPVYRSFEELIDYGKHLVFYNPSYTRFMDLGYGDVVNVLEEKLYAAKVKTSDGQIGWVQKDYLENSLTEDMWLVKEARTLRSSSSNSSPSLGTVPTGSSVYLLDHVTTTGTAYTEWYYIQTQSGQKGWIWGASNAGRNEGYNVIKYEFNKTPYTNHVTIFTPLTTKASVTADQINRFINYKTSGRTTVMTNMGYAYLKAQEETGLNAIYLLAHSGLETGWGNSSIVKAKYNFYGIGAIDSRPDEGAYNYSTPEGGIVAGALFIKKNYVDRSWDTDRYFPYSSKPTIDNMRFDNSWHQYATDEAWAVKIGNNAQDFYNFINN